MVTDWRLNQNSLNRRDFIQGMSAMAGIGLTPQLAQDNTPEAVEENPEPEVPSHPLADPERRIGVGIIGCGERGNAHIQYLNQLKEDDEALEITAVCDVYRPRLNQAVDLTQAIGYMNHEALLEDPDVDVVLIATPDRLHGYQSIDAIRAGKDVYCETPLTHWQQIDLTKRVFDEAWESEQVIQIGAQCMSYSAWLQAAVMIMQGTIGKPLHVQTGCFLQRDTDIEMSRGESEAQPGGDLIWERFLSDAPKRPFSAERFFQWKHFWDYAGGPATEWFPNILTSAVAMLGVTFPETVTASGGQYRTKSQGELPDTFHLTADYPEGLSMTLLCTSGNDYPIPTIVRGEEGTITFTDKHVIATPQPGIKRPKKFDPIYRWESMPEFWSNFLTCCRTRKQPWSPVNLGYYVQTALQMGVLAYRERTVVGYNRNENRIIF